MSSSRQTQIRYNRTAPWYTFLNALYFLGRDRGYRQQLVERLNLNSDAITLSSCVGTATDFPYILEKTQNPHALIGLDSSPTMIRQVYSHDVLGVNLIVCSITQLPFRNTVFSGAVVTFCLKLITRPGKALKEIARILRAGHRLGILANHPPHLPNRHLVAMFTKIVGLFAKVNFALDLKPLISSFFKIVGDDFLYLNLVRRYICEVPASPLNRRD